MSGAGHSRYFARYDRTSALPQEHRLGHSPLRRLCSQYRPDRKHHTRSAREIAPATMLQDASRQLAHDRFPYRAIV